MGCYGNEGVRRLRAQLLLYHGGRALHLGKQPRRLPRPSALDKVRELSSGEEIRIVFFGEKKTAVVAVAVPPFQRRAHRPDRIPASQSITRAGYS